MQSAITHSMMLSTVDVEGFNKGNGEYCIKFIKDDTVGNTDYYVTFSSEKELKAFINYLSSLLTANPGFTQHFKEE